MPENDGYFAVVVPSINEYQGFFLPNGLDVQADALIDKIRLQVGGRYTPPSVMISPTPGVNDEDQSLAGALTALLVEMVVRGRSDAVSVISVAVSRIIGRKWFWIEAEVTRGGTRTELNDIPAHTLEGAAAFVNNLPVVREIIGRVATKPGTRH